MSTENDSNIVGCNTYIMNAYCDIWFTPGYALANFRFNPGLGWRGLPLPKNKSTAPPPPSGASSYKACLLQAEPVSTPFWLTWLAQSIRKCQQLQLRWLFLALLRLDKHTVSYASVKQCQYSSPSLIRPPIWQEIDHVLERWPLVRRKSKCFIVGVPHICDQSERVASVENDH